MGTMRLPASTLTATTLTATFPILLSRPSVMALAVLDTQQHPHLPRSSQLLFEAKASAGLSFEQIARHIGRSEVGTAAIFYGQAQASAGDVDGLAGLLGMSRDKLAAALAGFPDRGRSVDMPPRDPLIYRLYEMVQNYGYAYKAVLNEKFGDGIMSGVTFSTSVDKETDADGNAWAIITLRGKWLPFLRF